MKATESTTPDVEGPDCGCQNNSASETDRQTSSKRRSLLRATFSAGPVILALSGKSAMGATTCRFPSTWASVDPAAGGNAAGESHHPSTGDINCGFGRSPGFWKQRQKRCYWPGAQGGWGKGLGPNPDRLKSTASTHGSNPCTEFQGDGTKVTTVFGVGGNKTFSQYLCSQNGTDIWHYMAAYLNAWTVKGYPLMPPDVVAMWRGSFKVGTKTWTRAEGRIFIEGTYDTTSTDPQWKAGFGSCKDPFDFVR